MASSESKFSFCESILTNSWLCQILSLSQGTKNHVWVLNQQGASVQGSNICFLQQFQKQTKTILCASDEIPSDYLLAVAPHNNSSSLGSYYTRFLWPFYYYMITVPPLWTNQKTNSISFEAIEHWEIPGLVKAECQENFGVMW